MGDRGRPLRTTRKVANLRERPGWYRIGNKAAGPVQVSIYDEIGMLGVSADALLRDLADIAGDIELHLNSPGGDVFDGIAIYNTLRQRPGNVAVVVDGLAASAASFIAQAASPGQLAMAPHAQMMIHDGFGMAIGNASDMREMAALLDKASGNIAGIYADRTGKPAAYWRERMQAETWYDDHEAVAEGLADSVVGQDPPVRDAWDLSVYLNAPVVVAADGNHAPMAGNHSHSHPAYGAASDGASHGHDHGHDGDADHHPRADLHVHTAGMGGEGGEPSGMHSHVHVQNAWDGPAAMAKCHSAADFRSICAGEKTTGEPDTQAHWALPHHNSPGGPANPDGVSAALGRLNQTHDLKSPEAARRHLEAHQSSSSDHAADDIWLELATALEGSKE